MSVQKFRSRKMGLLLYPDDESHVEAYNKLFFEYDVLTILHDKDTDEEGNLKKAHWHVFLSLKNQQWSSAIAKELGIGVNYIQNLRNDDNALVYLIHYNDSDKYQYDLDELKGSVSLKKRLVQIINKDDKSEGDKVVELISYIENYNGYLSVTEFAKYSAEQGYWDVFRRSGAIFVNILKEHNSKYYTVNGEHYQ